MDEYHYTRDHDEKDVAQLMDDIKDAVTESLQMYSMHRQWHQLSTAMTSTSEAVTYSGTDTIASGARKDICNRIGEAFQEGVRRFGYRFIKGDEPCRSSLVSALHDYSSYALDRLRLDLQEDAMTLTEIRGALIYAWEDLTSACELTLTALADRLQRQGQTRMPKKFVHSSVLADYGYRFRDQGAFYYVEGALQKPALDEIIQASKGKVTHSSYDEEGQDIIEVFEKSDEELKDIIVASRRNSGVVLPAARIQFTVDSASTMIQTEVSLSSGAKSNYLFADKNARVTHEVTGERIPAKLNNRLKKSSDRSVTGRPPWRVPGATS